MVTAAGGNDDAPKAGPTMRARLRERGVQGNGVGQVLASDQFDDKRLARRPTQAVRESQQHRQDIEMPELDSAGRDQYPEEKSLDHGRRLGHEQDAPFGPAIGKDSSEEREEQHRQRLQRAHQTELPGAVGQLQHQPGLPDALHPGADQRDHLAKPEQTIIALT